MGPVAFRVRCSSKDFVQPIHAVHGDGGMNDSDQLDHAFPWEDPPMFLLSCPKYIRPCQREFREVVLYASHPLNLWAGKVVRPKLLI